MKLRGIDFGPVCGASGVQGFFGEGYWYHKWFRPLGLDFKGMTFVAKTTTLQKRPGNMPMCADGITPCEAKPRCIVVKPFAGVALNAVGLSGPGAHALFEDGRWDARKEPFVLSFMSMGETRVERLRELKEYVWACSKYFKYFQAPVALQHNYSCPNTAHDLTELAGEVEESFEIESPLGVPLMPKFNVLLPPERAVEISQNKHCDAICVSNTIPWGELPEKIPWRRIFGSKKSPLARRFGEKVKGGLSGKPLLPLVHEWVCKARDAGVYKPINAGGGILHPDDVDYLADAGASSVFVGSVVMLRPWRVRSIIRRAHEVFGT